MTQLPVLVLAGRHPSFPPLAGLILASVWPAGIILAFIWSVGSILTLAESTKRISRPGRGGALKTIV